MTEAAVSPSKRGVLSEWRIGASTVTTALAKSVPDATLNFTDSYGQSIIQLIVEGGQMDSLQVLLAKKPLPNLDGTVLTAAAHGRTGMIPALARAGANVREVDHMGATALHRAVDNGHADVVKMLIDMGCPVDARDKLQRTPLHLAVQSSAVSCVVALLKNGADLGAVDDLGRNAGEIGESIRSAKGVDDESLAAIYDIFKEEIEGLKSDISPADHEDGNVEGHEAPAEQLVERARPDVLHAAAAATGDAVAPIRGINDIETLVALILAKFRASVEQELVTSFGAIYDVLDSAGDGHCSAGDLASGVLEMGIEIAPPLLQPLLERMTGRPGATTISKSEFEAFCGLTPEQLAAQAAEEEAGEEYPQETVELAHELHERFRVGVENEEQPSFEAYFQQIATSNKEAFSAAELMVACELFGVNGDLQEFELVVEYIWGPNHDGAAGKDIRVGHDEFIQFCDGTLV